MRRRVTVIASFPRGTRVIITCRRADIRLPESVGLVGDGHNMEAESNGPEGFQCSAAGVLLALGP